MRNLILTGLLAGMAACSSDSGTLADFSASAQEVGPVASEKLETIARHLGNEGIMIEQGETKILFDPLYRNGYNNYHLVPAATKAALLAAEPPFIGIDAMLISHAHGDHFDVVDTIAFHKAHPDALIIAPTQALEAMEATGEVSEAMKARFVPMGLDYGADPLKIAFEDMVVEAVRIPHAGGQGRRAIQNLVYRVTLQGEATIMHMGDADPAPEFFTPYAEHWKARETDTAFPPYWFFLSADGVRIVDETLNARNAIGLHVPVNEPANLVASGRSYFGVPGEVVTLSTD